VAGPHEGNLVRVAQLQIFFFDHLVLPSAKQESHHRAFFEIAETGKRRHLAAARLHQGEHLLRLEPVANFFERGRRGVQGGARAMALGTHAAVGKFAEFVQ